MSNKHFLPGGITDKYIVISIVKAMLFFVVLIGIVSLTAWLTQ